MSSHLYVYTLFLVIDVGPDFPIFFFLGPSGPEKSRLGGENLFQDKFSCKSEPSLMISQDFFKLLLPITCYLPLTTQYLLLTGYCLLLADHSLLLTPTPYSLLFASYRLLLTNYYLLLTIYYLLITIVLLAKLGLGLGSIDGFPRLSPSFW